MSNRRRARNLGPLPTGVTAAWSRTGLALSAVAEAVAAPPVARTTVRETATARAGKPGRLLVQLVKAGWSLNGNYYPAAVLERDGPRAWPKGTLNYVDHDTDAEEEARPSGTLTRLASYQTTDARWDAERQALVAEVRPFAPWRETVNDWAESGAIGMSIRAWVYGEQGEAEGRSGFVVSGIPEGRSCDYVTVPAAGGALLSVLESVRNRTIEARNIGAWLESRLHLALTTFADDMYGDGRLTRDERIVLSGAIGDGLQAWTARVEADAPQLFERDLWSYPEPAATDAEEARRAAEATTEETRAALSHAIAATYGGDDTYSWVRDFDPDRGLVWFDVGGDGESATWQQAYTAGDDGVALAGERSQVVARIVYDPVDTAEAAPTQSPIATAVTEDVTDGTPPSGETNPTEEEPAMSGTQTGSPPVQAGTATVPDGGQPPTTPTVPPVPPNDPMPTPPSPPPPAPVEPAQESATAVALRAVTEQLAAMQQQFAVLSARDAERAAESRRARNEHAARQAVEAAATQVPAQWRAQVTPRVTAAVLATIPTVESGEVDTVKLDAAVKAAVESEVGYCRTVQAQALEEAGVGLPTGLGGTSEAITDDGLDAELSALFKGSLGLSESAAAVAVKGRV